MRPAIRWAALLAAILALILIPFAFYEDVARERVADALSQRSSRPTVFWVVVGSLAADPLAPIPSSLVSAGAGYLLGLAPGAAASWLGMTMGAALGYGVGAWAGRPATRRLVGEAQLQRARLLERRFGAWSLVICRAVPVLAEASVILAGITSMSFARFAILTALANLAISIAYAAVGAYAFEANSFLLAFLGAILLPGVALLASRRLRGDGIVGSS